jgi:hypothetical protein
MAGWRDYLVVSGLAAVGLWWGGHQVKLGWDEREPLEMSCADYLAKRPAAHYLRLTGCEADFDNMAEETKEDDVVAVYLPLRPVGQTGAPHIVLVRNDDAIRKFASSSAHSSELTPEDRAVVDSLEGPQQGVVDFGISLSEEKRGKLADLNLGLAPDFVLLDEGAQPHLWWGLAVCAGALAALGWVLRSIVRRVRG